jgi:raffinose/stachyose/melibiose transport system permease protein
MNTVEGRTRGPTGVAARTDLTGVTAPKARRRTLPQRIWRRRFCYIAMLPTFLLLGIFTYFPAISAFYHAFTAWDGFTPAQWIGFANFAEMFRSDTLQHAWRNLIILTLWPVIQVLTIPVLVAELIFAVRSQRLAHFFRTIFVVPIVVPTTVTIMLWQYFYDPNVGLFNSILQWAGSSARPEWLADYNLALPSLMGVGFPWVNGIAVLIYLAGLLAIPPEVIDAGRLDGAVGFTRFRKLDLPLIMGQIKLMVILTVIGALQYFGLQLFLTNGGPANATTVPAYEMYEAALRDSRFGFASAIGVFLFVIIFTLTVINNRFIRSSVEYDAAS